MRKPAFEHVKAYRDRHGKWRRYFRRPGYRSVALPGEIGSVEFVTAYKAALAGETAPPVEIGAKRSPVGSVDSVVKAYLSSGVFAALADETKRTRRNILAGFAKVHGSKPIYYVAPGGKRTMLLTREHMQKIVNEKAGTPSAQRNFLNTLRAMFAWAMAEGRVPDDPTLGVKRVKIKTDEIKRWELSDVDKFIARHPLGTKAYLALMLLLDSGQRRNDVRLLGKQHVRGGVISMKQSKTGNAVDIPMTARLAEAIAAHPSDNMTFLVADRTGVPFTRGGFGNWFRAQCDLAGLPGGIGGFSAHGLRKTRATILADKGLSAFAVASVTGHVSIAEVQRYTKEADRKRLAREAMADEVEQIKKGTKVV